MTAPYQNSYIFIIQLTVSFKTIWCNLSTWNSEVRNVHYLSCSKLTHLLVCDNGEKVPPHTHSSTHTHTHTHTFLHIVYEICHMLQSFKFMYFHVVDGSFFFSFLFSHKALLAWLKTLQRL